MLKIVRSANPDFVLFTLSGHIDAEHVAELQTAFDGETLPIVLDLLEVKRVDREVVVDLARWNTDGIKFENCPAYLREWIARTQMDLARGFEAVFVDLKYSDFGFQRGRTHAEFRGSTSGAGHLAACFSQRCFDQRLFLGSEHLD